MKKFDRIEAVDYYIKGEYHCDKCPFCWGGEYMPGCDDYDDAGCYIFGDLRDTCRLIPPIRFILGWGRRKRAEYFRAHDTTIFQNGMQKKRKKKLHLSKPLMTEFSRILRCFGKIKTAIFLVSLLTQRDFASLIT